jgi:serine/threonine protein kinase
METAPPENAPSELVAGHKSTHTTDSPGVPSGVEQTASAGKRCPVCSGEFPGDYAVCPKDATPLVRAGPSEDPLLGQVLGEVYELTRLLGEGGMGRVYEARHGRLGKRFAVKLLHTHLSADPTAVARFRREATAAAAIHSPHCAQVVDVHATRDGRPYIVSELLEGEELSKLLSRQGGRLDVAASVTVARQVSRGLAAAHAAGVVHRDLKPENIMLVRGLDGRPIAKVVDFGIAKQFSNDSSLTQTGVVVGTPAFMAPEQARGSGALDHRVDVYALGAVLYRCLAGQAPFTGDSPTATLAKVLHDEPERLKALAPSVPDGLELVIQRAMARDPSDRMASMREFDEALAPYDTGATLPSATVTVPLAEDPAHSATMAIPSPLARPPEVIDRRARWARSRALLLASASAVWAGCAVSSLIGVLLRPSLALALNGTQIALALVLGAAVVVPAAILLVRELARGAWRNTATMLGYADLFESSLLAALSGYAVATLGLRFISDFVERSAGPGRVREAIALSLSLVVGSVAAWWVRRQRARGGATG